MIKMYKIKIGEKIYEVEVEAVSEKEGKIETETAKEIKREQPEKTPETAEGNTKIEAPMQGLVVSVNVSSGQKVKAGETLIILEAMKMENPIVAPVDGTVAGIYVSKGDTVENGTLIASLS